jgi:hypothetical protein
MIEIDQSNKVERLEKDTILALSNQQQYTIVVPSSVKNAVFNKLLTKGKSRKNAYLWIFSAGVFLLLKTRLPLIIKQQEIVVIDTEYTGHEANIKSMILRHCRNAGFNLPSHQIRFAQVGKSSNAHKMAYDVQRGRVDANKKIKQEEIMALM